MEFEKIKRVSMAEQVFNQLKSKIIGGEFNPGDKLPSESSLCEMFGVSRTTIRQALATLQSLDLIETKFGEGSFVKKGESSVAMHSLIAGFLLSTQSLIELIEFREMIEPNVTELACARATEEDIARLADIYHNMVNNQHDLTAFSSLDFDFHIEIARISRNSYIIKVYEITKDILISAFSDIVLQRGSSAGLKYHKLILESFVAHAPESAGHCMQEHMDEMLSTFRNAHP